MSVVVDELSLVNAPSTVFEDSPVFLKRGLVLVRHQHQPMQRQTSLP